MFRTLASAGLIAAAALGISAASPSKAEAGVLIQQAYYDGPGYGWRGPPRAYGYWGVPRWRRHYDGPRFYGPPPPPPRYYRRWREW